jgi:hypothetical protein
MARLYHTFRDCPVLAQAEITARRPHWLAALEGFEPVCVDFEPVCWRHLPNISETVRTIFRRYLDLGSMGAVIEDLDQRGIRTNV